MKRKQTLSFKRLSSELEVVLPEELRSFKGGGSDEGDMIELDEVIVTGDAPEDESDWEEPDWGNDPEPDPMEDEWEDPINDPVEWGGGGGDGGDINNDDEDLTPEEKWALKHPLSAADAVINKNVAEQFVNQFPGQHNGYGDAVRHALWMAQNALDFGKDLAVELGVAHEDSAPGPDIEREMDLNNNEWGATYGASVESLDADDFMEAFHEAVENGDIIIINTETIPDEPLEYEYKG